jgi:Tol biopolymer transport system component
MIKKAINILMLTLLPLLAQDFLKGVKAEDLMLDRIEAAPVNIVKEIENSYDNWFHPTLFTAYSADSSVTAAIIIDKSKSKGIRIIDKITKAEKRIDKEHIQDIAVSADGNYLAFIELLPVPGKLHRGRPIYSYENLCVYNLRTDSIETLISIRGRCISHSWSSVGSYLGFSYVNDTTGQYDFCVFDAEHSDTRKLDSFVLCDLWNFSWSPNGEMIVYTKPLKMDVYINEEVPLEAEIFVVNRDGSGKKQITNTSASELFVKWLPDGKKIVTGVVENPVEEGYNPKYKYYLLKKEE